MAAIWRSKPWIPVSAMTNRFETFVINMIEKATSAAMPTFSSAQTVQKFQYGRVGSSEPVSRF
jgi:hypothetical protein